MKDESIKTEALMRRLAELREEYNKTSKELTDEINRTIKKQGSFSINKKGGKK